MILVFMTLALDDIGDCLTRPEYSLERILELQIERIQEQIGRQTRLRDLIQHLCDRLRSAEGASVDDLTRTIEVTMNYEDYYTPQQMEQLGCRREGVGEERIQQVQQEWQELFVAYGRAMEEGLDAASDDVQALARKSAALIQEFTGGDPGLFASLGNMYRSEGAENVMAGYGMELAPGLWEYMGRATAALQS